MPVDWAHVRFAKSLIFAHRQKELSTMSPLALIQFALPLIEQIPTLAGSITAMIHMISQIHSLHDAGTAAPVIAQQAGAIMQAVLANTPQGATSPAAA